MPAHSVKREISRTQLLFISFAAIFGSGWLFAPLYAAQIAGPASLIAWVLGAVMSAVIGLTMAEVVVLFPRTGGMSQVTRVTHGELMSLVITVLNLLVFIILPAIEVRAVLQYLASYFGGITAQGGSFSTVGNLLAFLLLALITLVNLYGAKVTVALTKAVVLFKVVTPALICFSFLYHVSSSGTVDHTRLVLQGDSVSSLPWTRIFQAIAVSGIIFSFNGFNQATLFAGEARNPHKAIPFAILGSLLLSGLLYITIQYAFLMAIPKESFSQGWDKLAFPGDEGPFAGIATILGLGWLLTVIYADAVVSPLGTAFAYASAAPRLLYSLARGSRAQPNPSKTLIFVILALECLAFVLLPSLKAMIALLVAAFVSCYTAAPASLLTLRRTKPDLHRPFRVPFAPLVSFLSLFFSNLMVFSCGWVALRNLICVSAGLVGVYLIQRRFALVEVGRTGWFLFQLLAIGALCYAEKHLSVSFLVISIGIAGISLAALLLSQTQFENEYNLQIASDIR